MASRTVLDTMRSDATPRASPTLNPMSRITFRTAAIRSIHSWPYCTSSTPSSRERKAANCRRAAGVWFSSWIRSWKDAGMGFSPSPSSRLSRPLSSRLKAWSASALEM